MQEAEIFIKVRKRICVYSADYTGVGELGGREGVTQKSQVHVPRTQNLLIKFPVILRDALFNNFKQLKQILSVRIELESRLSIMVSCSREHKSLSV